MNINILRRLESIVSDSEFHELLSKLNIMEAFQLLYIGAEFMELPSYEKYDQLLNSKDHQAVEYDQIISNAKAMKCTQITDIDRLGLAKYVQSRISVISSTLNPSLEGICLNRPLFQRHEQLKKLTDSGALNVTQIANLFGFEASINDDCWELQGDLGIISLASDEDSYSDIWFDEQCHKTAEIRLKGNIVGQLSDRQVVELAHELGHCVNHLSSASEAGDFNEHYLLTEYPAFRAEQRLLVNSNLNHITPFAIEFYKQAMFSIFSILSPILGCEKSFEVAKKANPLYCQSKLTVDWLIKKPALFNPFLLPYIQYVVALDKLLFDDFSVKQYESYFGINSPGD